MTILVIGGAVLAVIGLGLLGYCIYEAVSVKRSGRDDDTSRARLQRLVAINLGALALSTLGLMAVVMGVILG